MYLYYVSLLSCNQVSSDVCCLYLGKKYWCLDRGYLLFGLYDKKCVENFLDDSIIRPVLRQFQEHYRYTVKTKLGVDS